MNIFEKATRLKLRFPTPKGSLSVEEIWDLPLKTGPVSLDSLAIAYHKAVKDIAEVKSFVDETPVQSNVEAQLRFDIVKHIIDTRKAENAAKLTANANATERERLESLIAEKEDEVLKNLSREELQARLDKLK